MFTGQEFDHELGLYNYKARVYDQESGRFLQADPVHSEHAGLDNFDRYQYVHNNPVNFRDPTGKRACRGLKTIIVYGHYTGIGACASEDRMWPGKQEDMIVIATIFGHPDEEFRIFALAYYYYSHFIKPVTPLTEVDAASQKHDTYGARFWETPHANNEWIREASSRYRGSNHFGYLPSRKMIRNTYTREYNATSGRWGPLRSTVASIATLFTVFFDGYYLMMGTMLFKIANFLYFSAEYLKVRLRNWDRPDEWRIHIARRGRFKNLDTPERWKFFSQGRGRGRFKNWERFFVLRKGRFKSWSKPNSWKL